MLKLRNAYVLLLVLCFFTVGCTKQYRVEHSHSVTQPASKAKASVPNDPYERFNRSTYKMNKSLDKVIFKPVAYLYLTYLPNPFQIAIGNFYDNMREVTNIANDLLQFKIGYMFHDTSRLLINSTFGLFGFFDPASALGLEQRKQDFGQTLYHWGYKESAYLVLPILGPSTFRDAYGMGVDFFGLSAWPWIELDYKLYLLALDFIDYRARLLRKETVLNVLAVDEYNFIRDAYFQHREYLLSGKKKALNDPPNGDIDSFFGEDDEDDLDEEAA